MTDDIIVTTGLSGQLFDLLTCLYGCVRSHGNPAASSNGSAMADNCDASNTVPDRDNCDTVGAVALDASGNFAYATSTGGITAKHTGRVGDSPLVGQ